MRHYLIIITLSLLFATSNFGQQPEKWTSAEIHEGIKKLNFLGSVLYLAAHPDDENQRLISYYSNYVKAHTTYLSLTRGDGGQNLIGTEIRELLGVLRTQELLAARRTDGGNQLFSRANDFGYSKHPDETLAIWNEKEVLSDVVWAIRKVQPDVIINRFDHRTPGTTHGHHTASAMLSYQAFDLAGDPSIYPEQLAYTQPWTPKRLFMNTSWWFYGSEEKFAEADKSNMITVDVGVYYPGLGLSNTEIASLARSNHKCQGFGNITYRGAYDEYLELLKGKMPSDQKNIFEGINTTWSRVANGAPIGEILVQAEKEYDFAQPSKSLPLLLKAFQRINGLKDGYWKNIKLREIKEVIRQCAGLYTEAVATQPTAAPGESMTINFEMINRSPADMQLLGITLKATGLDSTLQLNLQQNIDQQWRMNTTLPENLSLTTPYWLTQKASLGMYRVDNQLLRGTPETKRPLEVVYSCAVLGTKINFSQVVSFKKRDPVAGEVWSPFDITPPVAVRAGSPIYLIADPTAKTQQIEVKISALSDHVKGNIALQNDKNWIVTPSAIPFNMAEKDSEETVVFTINLPAGQATASLLPVVTLDQGQQWSLSQDIIAYDHIPTQRVFLQATAKIVKLDLKKGVNKVGYVMGAGDKVPEALRQVGYTVTELSDDDVLHGNLHAYDAIMIGIRAYNTKTHFKYLQEALLKYVKNGGTLIAQYNTSYRLKMEDGDIGPFPLSLSRDRVTDEFAPVTFLLPDHGLLHYPNEITTRDFDHWVQERGLYFPNEWADQYQAIFAMNDKGETPKKGSLLIAKYGKGHFIYTGISFFRELPAAVPGAFRLLANMLSVGKAK